MLSTFILQELSSHQGTKKKKSSCEFVRVMENLESHGKSKFQNPGLENLEISVGHGKSWKITFLLDQWIILSQFSSLTFSSFLGPPMSVKNIAKIVSTMLVTSIYHNLAVHFNSETGSQLPLWFEGAPVQLLSLFLAFPGHRVLSIWSRKVLPGKVMEFWWTNSVLTLNIIPGIGGFNGSTVANERSPLDFAS